MSENFETIELIDASGVEEYLEKGYEIIHSMVKPPSHMGVFTVYTFILRKPKKG